MKFTIFKKSKEPQNERKDEKTVEEKKQELSSTDIATHEKTVEEKKQELSSTDTVTHENNHPSNSSFENLKPYSQNNNDVENLTKMLSSSDNNENVINPNIDFNLNRITYPLLRQIGKHDNDVAFLEKLASPEINILKKSAYERLLVCPEHRQYFTVNIRLCCSSCSSTDITKLHLIEHKICGYLAEQNEFSVNNTGDVSSCPSCKKKIIDFNREIRKTGTWYKCDNCKSKFDNAKMKLYCRRFKHEFYINEATTISIPYFELVTARKEVGLKSNEIEPS